MKVLGDDVTQEDAFARANDVLRNAVGGISDIIHTTEEAGGLRPSARQGAH